MEIVIQTLVSVTPERWQNGVAFYQQLNGIAPVLPTPLTKLEQGDAGTSIKTELEAPQTSLDGPQPPSPTTDLYQETSIQELDVDPEALVNPPRELSSFEKHQVFQEILHRFFELDYRFAGASATP